MTIMHSGTRVTLLSLPAVSYDGNGTYTVRAERHGPCKNSENFSEIVLTKIIGVDNICMWDE